MGIIKTKGIILLESNMGDFDKMVSILTPDIGKIGCAAKAALYTGHIGDGKIFIYNIENVVKIRTNEEGYDALQDD